MATTSYAAQRRWYETKGKPERERKIASGICAFCSDSAIPGKSYCVFHSEKAKQRYREKRKPDIERRRALGLCYFCESPAVNDKTRCERHQEYALKNQRICGARYNKKSKTAVFEHYGKSCACCGESNLRFLTIDHVNNDGAEHRRNGGTNLYGWLLRRGFPDGFQVLCFNCNCGRYHNGGICPHKQITEG